MPNRLVQAWNALFGTSNNQPQSLTNLWFTSTTQVYPDPGSQTAITRGFKGNAAVSAIVRKAAKKFGSVPRYVEPKGQEGKDYQSEETLEGPLMDLLNRPNPREGQDILFAKIYMFFKLCGESIIWCNRGDTDVLVDDNLIPLDDEAHAKKPILEIYAIPPTQIVLVPDPNDVYGILYWQLTNFPNIKFRKVDIIQWVDITPDWDPTTRSHMRGLSVFGAGNKILEANNSATDATVRMNQNGGAKGVLANELGGQNPTQQSQVEKVLDEKINNIDVKGAVAALQGKWTYLDVGLTSVDMETLKGKQLSMQELCFLLGMPYEFFDSQVTYANKQEAQKGWIINEIMPDCKQLDGEMNRVLLKAFGLENTGTICSDFDDLAELQEDKAKQVEWMMKAPLTVDEIREGLGYEPIGGEDGEAMLLPSGVQLLDDVIAGDGGEELMQQLYNANGNPKPTNGVAKKVPA